MKDIIDQARKAYLVISALLITLISSSAFSQKEEIPIEYQVINDFFSKATKVNLYEKSTFDKGWADYFRDENFSEIESKSGFPSSIQSDELKQILDRKTLEKINRSIDNSVPIPWNPSYLDNQIHLKEKYDTKKALNNNVMRFSMPIVIGNLAILKKTSLNESPIYILRHNGENWEKIYTFYDWLILY